MIRRLIQLPYRLFAFALAAASATGNNVATAFVQIWANKGRSILTTLGIIIAVTSTIVVVSIVQGFGNYMTDMVRGYGTQFMVVRPHNPSERNRRGIGRVSMDIDDIEAVRTECKHIRRLTPFVYAPNAEVTYGLEVARDVPMRGVNEYYQTIRNFHADAGRFFGPIDVSSASSVVVLGRTVVKNLEASDAIIGDYVQIDRRRFLVIGLLGAKGGMMGNDQDNTIMIPYTTALNMYSGNRRYIQFLAEAASEEDIPQAQAEITRVLRTRHRLQPGQPDDFSIDRQDQALSTFETIRNVATGILAGIVSISLLVGGIGIMNVMLVSVTERTQEIGLRKSVGGRRRDILLQFLTEAVVLCAVGGAVGVFAGYVVTYLVGMQPDMIEITVPWWIVVIALVSSAGAGVVFGIIPAFKAAILLPIEELRHE